ncbi:nucleotidyltransferase AbiEii toxin of type IV toxin-antitoxin system [Phyllobacterium bourgognense]|uniref:Nucleotidyltransferase AbiEii toxin of type IV toxin-antitoxin system n=1 Tax=Phyllobacterium bourgognense TaxID=314236 RepID=A0A368YST1_9HYPH|nr:nucleotidyltransferase AbiEii toxin of type IV toxin-antitoxin system [Phyllobacterium bourgognense]
MAKPPTNMAKSVKDRLLNIARKEGRAFDVLLVRFALERLLYRLSISAHSDRFVLKGGMLVIVWVADDNRVTRDADFLGHGDDDPDRLIADFGKIMAIESDDGLTFDIDALVATVIREEMEYGGVRKTAAYLERTRIPVTIDIGFGDALADPTQRARLSDPAGFSRSAGSLLSARHGDRREVPGNGGAWRPQRTDEGLLRPVGDPACDGHFR